MCSALVAFSTAPAFAGLLGDDHSKHMQPAAATAPAAQPAAPATASAATPSAEAEVKKPVVNPVRAAYSSAAGKMHHAMMIKYTGNADVDFVRGMIPHHQGAINMAKIELKYGKNEEMRKLAKQIIAAQEQEIAFMNNWLRGRVGVEKDAKGKQNINKTVKETKATAEFKKIALNMHKDMKFSGKCGSDAYFAEAMIPHHQAAIDMAWVLKREGDEPELRAMLDDIIRSQGQEIAIMKDFLANKGKK